MIIKRKLFGLFDKLPYKNKWQRIKDTAQGTLGGTIGGGIAGGMMGILGGFKGMRTGAILGASIGALLGSKLGWESGSKEFIDRENKRREKLKGRVENPERYFRDFFKDDQSKSNRLKSIEVQYDVKFSKDIYKLLNIRKQFISQILDWYKKYNIDPETGFKLLSIPMSVMYDVFPGAIEADLEVGKDRKADNPCCAILTDPGQADDTFIIYFTETRTYGFDITEKDGKYGTLKSAIIDLCKDNIDFYSKYGEELGEAILDLYKRWMKFISQKL